MKIFQSMLDSGVMPEHVVKQVRQHLVELNKLQPTEETSAEDIEREIAETEAFINHLEQIIEERR